MKNVTGGIPYGYVWVICTANGGGTVREISPCDPCAHCTTGGFISFAPGYSCPSCNL
jgi:hypothetical protein